MGSYINQNSQGEFIGKSFQEKVSGLEKEGAVKIPNPKEWEEGLVCVVDNGFFGAAAFAYDEDEMQVFLSDTSGRRTQWLKLDNARDLAE